MAELSDAVHAEVLRLSSSGDEFASDGKYAEAIGQYERALELLPKPRHDWDAFTWLKVAIADAYFYEKRFDKVCDVMKEVMLLGPEENGANTFIQLRYGQALLEAGKEDLAADWLARAFLTKGRKLFMEDDRKYLDFICSKLLPPAGFTSWEEVFAEEDES